MCVSSSLKTVTFNLLAAITCVQSQHGIIQEDPIAMSRCYLDTLPLIDLISNPSLRQIWYDGNVGTVGSLQKLLKSFTVLLDDTKL